MSVKKKPQSAPSKGMQAMAQRLVAYRICQFATGQNNCHCMKKQSDACAATQEVAGVAIREAIRLFQRGET